MLIENPDVFKSWLASILEPICDADPVALAKYVYALVKKDSPIPELRKSMLLQLEVFLQKETISFVNSLFDTLLSKENKEPATVIIDPNIKVKQEPQEKVETPKELPVPVTTTNNGEVNKEREKERDKEVRTKHKRLKDREREQNVKDIRERVEEKQIPIVSKFVGSKATASLPEISSYVPVAKRNTVLERRYSRPRDIIRVHNKADSEKDRLNQVGCSRLSRRSSSQRIRSRSPQSRSHSCSWERRHSSRSRSCNREHAWRNKSPSARRDRYNHDLLHISDRGRSPKSSNRSPDKMSHSRSLTRSRSPPIKRVICYRNRSPPSTRSHLHRRSVEGSRLDKALLAGSETSTRDSNHVELDHCLGTSSQNIKSVVSVKESGSMNCVKQKCLDFDSKGYCMRGDQCPYDHGVDPVNLGDMLPQQVAMLQASYQFNSLPSQHPPAPMISGEESMAHIQGSHSQVTLPHPENNLAATGLNAPLIIPPPPIHPFTTIMNEYNPDVPNMDPRIWRRPSCIGSSNTRRMMRNTAMRSCIGLKRAAAGYTPHHQRELVSVPVADSTNPFRPEESNKNGVDTRPPAVLQHQNVENQFPGTHHSGLLGAKNMKNYRIPQNNCSLELKKIPHRINNITQLNNHFAKFGKIVNIKVNYKGDPESALITFSSHAEANAACKSTDAVLNNRFIKLYWHNSEGKQENVPPRNCFSKERLGTSVTASASNKVLNALQPSAVQPKENPKSENKMLQSENKTKFKNFVLRKRENLHITSVLSLENKEQRMTNIINFKKTQEIQAAKEMLEKKQVEKRKEALKLTANLRKRKQELLTKQIEQQKLLIGRLESSVLPEQRNGIRETIKTLQESIESIQKDLTQVRDKINGAKITVTPQSVKKTREETQRQILDTELDIFKRQQEGKDTSDLERKMSELKELQARTLGLLSSAAPPFHFPPARVRSVLGESRFRTNRRGSFSRVSVDHRTTKLLVSGFKLDDKNDILAHFTQFGQLIDYIADDSTPSLIITYKSRKEAEYGFKKGRIFGKCLLSVTWTDTEPRLVIHHVRHKLHHRSVTLIGEEVSKESLEADEEDEMLKLGEELQDEEEDREECRSWRR